MDQAKLADPERIVTFKAAIANCSLAPWEMPVDIHAYHVNNQIREAAMDTFGKAGRTKRKSYISADTWAVIELRRHMQRELFRHRGNQGSLLLDTQMAHHLPLSSLRLHKVCPPGTSGRQRPPNCYAIRRRPLHGGYMAVGAPLGPQHH